MSQNWFIRSKANGSLFGPYPVDLIKTYIAQGRIDANYTVSSNKKHWQEISDWIASDKKKLGKYEIIRELGRGGMGAVYLAYDPNLQRKCALKVMLNKDDAAAIKRFQIEAKAVAQIQHPNIIHIYDICETPHHFFVMDYIEGIPLDEYIIRLSIHQKVQLFAKICDAIAFAHSKNILHRDLKPANILVRHDGEPIIVDFGLAKNVKQQDNLTKTGDMFGTPKYMAPEITQGKPGTHQVDVYALGVILYEMLTGRVPFDGENHLELLYQLTMSEAIPPSKLNSSIPKEGDLETICLKALEKSPQKRISTVKFLQREIKSFLDGEPIRLKPPTRSQKLVKGIRNHPIWSIVVVFVFATTSFYIWTEQTFRTKEKKQEHFKQLEIQSKLMENQELLAKSHKSSIENYLRLKIDEQFFHLAVIDKLKDLKGKEEAEKELYNEYDNLQMRKHKFEQNGFKDLAKTATQQITKNSYWAKSNRRKQQQENTRYKQRLNDRLRFATLPNFPLKTTHNFKNETLSVCISPKSNYIAQKITTGEWLLWNSPFAKELTKDKATVLDFIPRNSEKSFCTFSPDEKLLVVGENNILYFVDLPSKRIFSTRGLRGNISFDQQNDLVSFFSRQQRRDFVEIYSRKTNKVVRKFQAQGVFFADFSANTLVAMYDDGILVHNFAKKKTNVHRIVTAYSRGSVVVNKEKNELIFLSRLTLCVFNLKTQKMRSVPFEFFIVNSSSKRKTFIMMGKHKFAFLRTSGEIIISYPSPLSNKNAMLISSRRLMRSDKNIYKLDFVSPYFLGAFTDGGVDLISSMDGEKIITIDKQLHKSDNAFIDGHLVPQQRGLLVSVLTAKNYEEYLFPFDKYVPDQDTRQLLEKFTSFYNSSESAAQATLISKDFFISASVFGFLVWKNGQFLLRHRVLQSPNSYKLSNDGKYLAILFKDNDIHLYNTQDFTKPDFAQQSHDQLLNRSTRKFIQEKAYDKEETRCISFTNDSKSLLLVKRDLQIFSVDIHTRKIRCLVSKPSELQYKVVDMLHTDNGYTLIGVNEYAQRKGGVAIISPENKRTVYPIEGNYVSAISTHNSYFAIATENGNVEVYENFSNPEKKMSFRLPGAPLRLLFSPDQHYLAIFTKRDIYICNLKIYDPQKANDVFRIYRGHFKRRVAIFSNDWKKAYFANGLDILVFDQSFFIDNDSYIQRVQKLEEMAQMIVTQY